jgi:hypothetical protein
LLNHLSEKLRGEDSAVSYTMEDFNRQYVKERLARLTPQEMKEVLQALPPEELAQILEAFPVEERLAGLSAEQIRQYLDQLNAARPAAPRKPRRKK